MIYGLFQKGRVLAQDGTVKTGGIALLQRLWVFSVPSVYSTSTEGTEDAAGSGGGGGSGAAQAVRANVNGMTMDQAVADRLDFMYSLLSTWIFLKPFHSFHVRIATVARTWMPLSSSGSGTPFAALGVDSEQHMNANDGLKTGRWPK